MAEATTEKKKRERTKHQYILQARQKDGAGWDDLATEADGVVDTASGKKWVRDQMQDGKIGEKEYRIVAITAQFTARTENKVSVKLD